MIKINFEKTKILDKDKDRLWPVMSNENKKGENIKAVHDFTYLGVSVSYKGKIEWTYGPHFDQIVARAKKYKSAIYKIGVESIDRGETIKICWENIAIPSILFVCETTIFTEKTLKTLEKIQCEIAKLCLGVRRDTSGLGARVEAGMVSMSSRVTLIQINYVNSVMCRPDSNAYQAWIENVYGCWQSPLRKLWSKIKDKTFTRGEFGHKRVKDSVMALENLKIDREMKDHKSLQFMTTQKVKPRGRYLRRFESQDILKAFRVGDWRLGIKELERPGIPTKCPFGCHALLDLPHFLFWCSQLDAIRKESGIFDFFCKSRMNSNEETDIVKKFLWAMDDDPAVVKSHGSALIKMRNSWYQNAISKNINLNVRTKLMYPST